MGFLNLEVILYLHVYFKRRIGVYVDDIILACRSDDRMSSIKKALSEKFTMKDLGE
uniref:Reverse transcriptase Ty1/copia-type domain-containing protein n=1 Tax=Amphimedon queenslandica TaxID=400682 RepID=A0A1X7VD05_AMPQE